MEGKRPITAYLYCPVTIEGVTIELLSGPMSVQLRVTRAAEEFDGSGCTNPVGLIAARQIRGARK